MEKNAKEADAAAEEEDDSLADADGSSVSMPTVAGPSKTSGR